MHIKIMILENILQNGEKAYNKIFSATIEHKILFTVYC